MKVKVEHEEAPEGYETPPFSVVVHYVKKTIEVSIVLHKIPDQYIHLEPTETHFHLNTSKYTKKYWLSFRYPQKIQIDPTKISASLECGIVKVSFQVTRIFDAVSNKMLARKIKSDTAKDANPKSNPKNMVREQVTNDQDKNASRKPTTNNFKKDHGEKLAPSQFSAISSRGKPLTTKSKEVSMIEEIHKKFESKTNLSLQKEKEKLEHFERVRGKKEKKKEMIKSKVKAISVEMKEKLRQEKIKSTDSKLPSTRRVRFSMEQNTFHPSSKRSKN